MGFNCLISRQASDSKREQFRRYLEKAGVVDSLTSGRTFFFKVLFYVFILI